MDINEIESAIEGILFASGDPVSIERLCKALNLDRETLEKIAQKLSDEYLFNQRGIRLIRLDNSLQLTSSPEHADLIQSVLEVRRPPALSSAALEVLAIVAYRHPVTRAYIEQLRGVDSTGTVSTLIQKELIEECGKLDVPGRPSLFRTTNGFLRTFGLKSVNELPDLSGINGEEGDQLSILFSSKLLSEESS